MNNFFQELHGVAQHTPMSMIITPQGADRLNVIIMPKPTGDAANKKGLSQPITCLGTPAELDAELPAKLGEYAARVNDVRASFNLPLNDVDAEKKKAEAKERKAAEKKAEEEAEAKKKEEAAAKRKAAKEAADKEAADKAADRQRKRDEAKALKTAAGGGAPAASTPATETEAEERTRLIAEARTLLAKHGKKLNREMFVKKVKGGRRYERIFGSFRELLDAAAQDSLPLGDDSAPNVALPGATAAAASTNDTESTNGAAAPAQGGTSSPPAEEPAIAAPPPPPPPEPARYVVDAAGNPLAEVSETSTVGSTIALKDHAVPLRVLEVKPSELSPKVTDRDEVYVVAAWPVHDGEWNALGVWLYDEPAIGQTFEHNGKNRKVLVIENGAVMTVAIAARPAAAPAASAAEA